MDLDNYLKILQQVTWEPNLHPEEGARMSKYLSAIKHFFSKCEGKQVLEIGPFDGWHTALIDSYNPEHMTLVEANPECEKALKDQYTNATVVIQDIFHFLEKPYKVDVVACCGVLYHLHSPIYLLELIANRTDPEYIILESVVIKGGENNPYKLCLNTEVDNTPGNRYTASGWKSAGLNIEFAQDVLDKAMYNLGYYMVERDDDLGRFEAESKKFATITLYKKR